MLLSPLLQLGCYKSPVHIKKKHVQGLCQLRNAFVMDLYKWCESQYHALCKTSHFASVDEISAK